MRGYKRGDRVRLINKRIRLAYKSQFEDEYYIFTSGNTNFWVAKNLKGLQPSLNKKGGLMEVSPPQSDFTIIEIYYISFGKIDPKAVNDRKIWYLLNTWVDQLILLPAVLVTKINEE
jgi:hypothetical protein